MKIYLSTISFLIFLIACENPFAPRLTDIADLTSTIITDQKTPEDVLTNFRYAYVFKDSLIYSDLLDSNFKFISKNYSTTPPTDIYWGRDVDIKTTMGLFRHFQTLELNWGAILVDEATDSIQRELKITFQLTLDGGREIPTIKGEALFNFHKKKSGIWKIIRWDDLSSF
jgi:hypothetical protein